LILTIKQNKINTRSFKKKLKKSKKKQQNPCYCLIIVVYLNIIIDKYKHSLQKLENYEKL